MVTVVHATAIMRAYCRYRAAHVYLLAAISAIAETNQELLALRHQGSKEKDNTQTKGEHSQGTMKPAIRVTWIFSLYFLQHMSHTSIF